jgi:hypothetical protein
MTISGDLAHRLEGSQTSPRRLKLPTSPSLRLLEAMSDKPGGCVGQAAFSPAKPLAYPRDKMRRYSTWCSRRLPEKSPSVNNPQRVGSAGPTETIQDVATPGDVRGSRLPTHLTLANAKFDEYGFNSGHAAKRLPSRRWNRLTARSR